MNTKIENQQINSELTLYDSSISPLTVRAVNLALTKKDDEIIECRLTFQVNLELYQRIDNNALFNLNPVVRISPNSVNFQPELNIQIEASLKPDFLPHLLEHATNADEAATYIFNHNSPDTLLFTENWLGLSVKQSQNLGEVGYHTFWSHFSLLGLSMASNSQEEISEGITSFFQDLVSLGLDSATKEINPASIGEIANFFRDLSKTTSKISSLDTTPSQPIFDALVNFFREDDWQFEQLNLEHVLRIPFQGKNGKWNCYAKARETHQHFVFYSICPIKAPESKRQAIAEFITRANYDMIIGNFELEFSVGEIRYKTSFDVEGETLSFIRIKNLVYTNVNMMDKYLPGIMAVIAGDVLPISAINQIEPNSNIYQASDKQEELAFNSSSQPDIQQQEKTPEIKSHILARLTPEEIGQLHQALQMLEPYQRKQTQAIIEKVKTLMIARLDDLGTELFDEAFTFFKRVKFPAIILKLIQRYSRMARQTRLFIQQLKDWVKQSGEVADNSDINLAIEDLEELFRKINKRLEELPTDKLLGEKELIYLIEIEQFREQLAFFSRFIKDIE